MGGNGLKTITANESDIQQYFRIVINFVEK